MNEARPSERLLRTLLRKQLEQILDLLDSLDVAQSLVPGDVLDTTNANRAFQLDLRVTRLGIQGTLPFVPPAEPPRVPPVAGPVKLGRIHRKILEKASPTDPRPAKKLIHDAGYEENSYSWAAITYLSRHRLLMRTPDGYLRLQAS